MSNEKIGDPISESFLKSYEIKGHIKENVKEVKSMDDMNFAEEIKEIDRNKNGEIKNEKV